MAMARRRGGFAFGVVGLAAAALAASACGPGDPPGGVAPPAPDADPGQPAPPAPPAAADPSWRTAPEGPRAATRWVRILDADAGGYEAVRVAAAPDGSFVATTREPGDPPKLRRLTVQRIDAAGVVRWKTSLAPSCHVSVKPIRVSPAGEIFLATKAECDDALPGLWPVPRGGSIVVLGEDGAFRRRVAVGADWYFAEVGPDGDVWTAEERVQNGGLTFRKRSADGAVLWENRDFFGTKRSFSLAVTPDGGAYAEEEGWVTRLRADGTAVWDHGFGVGGYHGAWMAVLEDGAVAGVGTDYSGVPRADMSCGIPGVAIVEADGSRRGKTRVPGCFEHQVTALRGGGVGVLAGGGAFPGPWCRWIEALGPDLRTRWARRVEETCRLDDRYWIVGAPAAGTIGVGGLVSSRADFGDGAVVEPEPGKQAAVLVSIDATPDAAAATPPSAP